MTVISGIPATTRTPRHAAAPGWRAVLPLVRAGRTIIGIDEVGRGAWAGPVVAAAVILPPRLRLPGLGDSKALAAPARRRLSRDIRRRALAVGIGWVAAAEVDAHGLSWAVRESGLRALAGMSLEAAVIILDGRHNYLRGTHESQVFVKADATISPVAAASIIAKVARDAYMQRLHRADPRYGFDQHVGYGTALHAAGLAAHGPGPQHRYSFRPIREAARVIG
ncbi:MAG TPA: ribonuclease HII [Candidatus Saccharimonadia bacterium]|nr:ribonuclease HII [Candidatus Saccharimonadia bacterium]